MDDLGYPHGLETSMATVPVETSPPAVTIHPFSAPLVDSATPGPWDPKDLRKSSPCQVCLKNHQPLRPPVMIHLNKKTGYGRNKKKTLTPQIWAKKAFYPGFAPPRSFFFPLFLGISAEEMVAMTRPALEAAGKWSAVIMNHKWGDLLTCKCLTKKHNYMDHNRYINICALGLEA